MPKKEHQKSVSKKHDFCYIFDILVTLSGLDLVLHRNFPEVPRVLLLQHYLLATHKVQIQ